MERTGEENGLPNKSHKAGAVPQLRMIAGGLQPHQRAVTAKSASEAVYRFTEYYDCALCT